MNHQGHDEFLRDLSSRMCASYASGQGVSLSEGHGIPQRATVILLLEELLEVLFPGYSGRRNFSPDGLFFHTGGLLEDICGRLVDQVKRAFSYRCRQENCTDECREKCERQASETVRALLDKLPELRQVLLLDVQAALDGDPATRSADEVILAYPGFKAICIHRLAHELYQAKVPLIPRIMSEYAHTVTGIDINPGASIGQSLFIDHGTAVVIGETAVIGDHVKIYQGVTLGALSFPKDGCGKLIKGAKRHPNIEDHVTLYAGATILGNITIGHHSIIGGNVWLTEGVEPYSKVTFAPADSVMTSKKRG